MEPPPPIHQYRCTIVKERSTIRSAYAMVLLPRIATSGHPRPEPSGVRLETSYGLQTTVRPCGILGLDPVVRPDQSAVPDNAHDSGFAYQPTACVTIEHC